MPLIDSSATDGLSSGLYHKILKKASTALLVVGTVLIPIFYLPFTMDVLNLPKQFLLYIIVLLGLLLWLSQVVLTKELILRRTILDIPLVVFGVLSIISAIVSLSTSLSFLGKTDSFVLNVGAIFSLIFWFWLVIQNIDEKKKLDLLINSHLVSGIILCVVFLIRKWSVVSGITNSVGDNLVSRFNSIFAVYVAALLVMSLGLLMVKSRSLIKQIIPALSLVFSAIVLARVSFTVGWVVLLVGLALLLVIGITMLAETRIFVISLGFFLFLLTILILFVGSPQFIKTNLPVEVSLGNKTSWKVSYQTITGGVKPFLLGSGPGTFIYDFSHYRPAEFNVSQIAWSTRFQQPFNSVYAILSEFGILGFVSFIFVFLLSIGAVFSGWLRTRPSIWNKVKGKVSKKVEDMDRVESFIPAAAWLAFSVGLFVAFFDSVAWWAWFWFLSISIVSLSMVVPELVRKRKVMLQVSPQYALAMSFGMVLLFSAIIIFGAFGFRYYLAEVAYSEAARSNNLNTMEKELTTSIRYRPSYPQYHIAIARVYLQKAKNLVEVENASPEEVAPVLAKAVNEAKLATDVQPNNVQTWDILSLMYLNARAFAPDANQWARDALQKAVDLEPTNPTLYWRLANTYIFDNDLEQAEEHYKKAIELKPDYIDAYSELSRVYEVQERYDEAIALYEPIMPVVQQQPGLLFDLGRLFYNRDSEGDIKKAEISWLRAVELMPDYSNALYGLAVLYEKTGNTEKSLEYYRRVQELNPDNQDLQSKLDSLINPPPPAPVTPEAEEGEEVEEPTEQ
ncbi:MAG: tetratricopeptide repeat protein [Candidatus Magasanikbacteria bacterium]|nr:tetratricopeptide repeat protein [Candidatus Magasanikbacteria bacterium]